MRHPNFTICQSVVNFRKLAILNAQSIVSRTLRHSAVLFGHVPMPFGFLGIIHDAIPLRKGYTKKDAAYAVGGVPMLRRFPTAVTNFALANGFETRMLFGTPCDAHSSADALVT